MDKKAKKRLAVIRKKQKDLQHKNHVCQTAK